MNQRPLPPPGSPEEVPDRLDVLLVIGIMVAIPLAALGIALLAVAIF